MEIGESQRPLTAGVGIGEERPATIEKVLYTAYTQPRCIRRFPQVGMADLSSGGPPPGAEPFNAAPAPIATRRFRRFVPLGLPRIEGIPAVPDPLDPPIELTVTRPKVGYPTALFADAADAEDRLLADAQRIIADGAGDAPGIPDPDAATAEISVAVAGLRFDSANDGNGIPPVRTIYTTTRAFPDDADEPLVLALDWIDVADVTTLVAPAAGSIPLPRAREVIITVRAVGRSDPGLDYFGSEPARFGDPTSVQMFAAGLDETGFFVTDDPARQLRCVLLRPQEIETLALLARLRASGRGTEADTSPLHLLAEDLSLETSGPALWAEPGRRVIFACSRDLAHVLSPDGSAVTFSSEADITDRWISVLTVGIQRDWTWNGDDRVGVEISRDGSGVIGRITLPRSVNPEVFQAPEIAGAPVDRAATYLVFMDIIDPKPVPPAHPSEMSLSYTVTPVFRHLPEDTDDYSPATSICRSRRLQRKHRGSSLRAWPCRHMNGMISTRRPKCVRGCCGSSSRRLLRIRQTPTSVACCRTRPIRC